MLFNRITISVVTVLLLTSCKTIPENEVYANLNDQQLFQIAEQDLKKGHYEQAIKEFEALDTNYPFGNYSQQSQLDIIKAYHKAGNSESALAAIDRYIRLYPHANNIDYVYYLKGCINKGQTPNWFLQSVNASQFNLDASAYQEALTDFSLLIHDFPNSIYVPAAKHNIDQLRILLATHELGIAQYYFDRKIYIAAVNRANDVITEYPQTPQAIEARQLMVQSYHALNEPQLAKAAASDSLFRD